LSGQKSIVEFFKFRPQTTILNAFELTGITLFTGKIVRCKFYPALPDTGIVFKRVDLPYAPSVQARAKNVVATPRCTVIGENNATVQLVEHLLSAIYGLGIDNLIIEIDGPEVPIFDGSSSTFVDSFLQANTVLLAAQKPIFKLIESISCDNNNTSVLAEVSGQLKFSYLLHYDATGVLEHQEHEFIFESQAFHEQISSCRTFSSFEEIQPLLEKGFIRGGSLENGIIVKDGRVLNESGLRFPNEMARHKVLDMIGDLCLIGHDIIASFKGDRSGHAQTTKLAQILESHIDKYLEQLPYVVQE
jgi:UDP-3-O-[3-hydroxymyristoyl] N-acetylglucosamine deacetylase